MKNLKKDINLKYINLKPINSLENIYELVGFKIKMLRLKNNYTINYFSQITGISISMISKIENGKTAVSLDKLVLISIALDIPMYKLFR